MIILGVVSPALGLSREGHHRDGDVLLLPEALLILVAELVDRVAIVTEEADYPLVRPNVDTAIDSLLIVWDKGVLPLVGPLERSLEA